MKNKLIYANFNAETGISDVVIRNKNGTFMGIATCHPEEEAVSDYAGCRYAEIRANIKAIQYEKRMVNAAIKELEDFEKILKSLKDYNPNSVEARRLRRRIHEKKEERIFLQTAIIAMKNTLKRVMNERDELIKKHSTLKDVMKDQYHKDKSE